MTTTGSWRVVDRRHVPQLHAWRESIMTTANGWLSTRGSLEEPHEGRSRATFVHGLFVTPPGGIAQQTAVPDWTDLRITIDGEPFGVDHGWMVGHERSLDLSTGEVVRDVLWRGEHTPTVGIRFRRLLPLHDATMAAMDVEVRLLDGDADLAVETGIDAGVRSPNEPMWRPLDWRRPAAGTIHLQAASVDDAHRLDVTAQTFASDASVAAVDDPFHHRWRFERHVELGQRWSLAKRVRYTPRRPGEDAGGKPLEMIAMDDLRTGSRLAWDRYWDVAAIAVDGDPEVTLALRYAAFQLLAAAPRDHQASIPAKLLSGFGYLGHVFWDTDVFIVPWLSMVTPELAANHLRYRWRGLPAARRKAARYGRTGAFFPWEADDRGEECTPDVVVPHAGGPPIPVHTARYEEHISADVAWATWDHRLWSGDQHLSLDHSAELILDTARYWAGRVEIDADGTGHVRDVIGPDEYHERIDDSWYTNRLVRWHLDAGAGLLDRLDTHTPQTARRMRDQLDLAGSAGHEWRTVSQRLVLPTREDGTPLAHARFDALESIDLSAWEPRRTTMERLLGQRTKGIQVVKQADVVMALALLGPDAAGSPEAAAAALDYYLPMTDHGSSLSLPVHAWLAARLGRAEQAYQLLRDGIAIEHDDAMGNGHVGLHAATNGGLLLATLRGFAGVAAGTDGPTTAPNLPDHWHRLAFTVQHRGRRYDIEL